MPVEIEFWPEYGSGPLWMGGVSAAPADLVPLDLSERLTAWNDEFADEKLPSVGDGDRKWLEEGRILLDAVRAHLQGDFVVVVTEPWFD